jgi:hypothetical protein
MLSDHQDSEHFSYEREWEEIEEMLHLAERRMNNWIMKFHKASETNNRKVMREAARNKKALEGVVKTLRWVLGDKNVDHPLE